MKAGLRAAASVLALVSLLAGCVTPPSTPGPGGDVGDESGDAMSWEQHAAAPMPRTEVAGAAIDSDAYVIGGYVQGAVATNAVAVYNAAEDAWREGPMYPLPVHHTAAVNHEGTLYVLGGYTTSAFVPTDLSFKLDPGSATWTPIASLPTPRGAHAAAVVDGRIYVTGGVGPDQTLLADVHVYDPVVDAWSTAPDLPTPRDHLAASAVNGKLYVVGGREQSFDTNTGRLEAYDPASGGWETMESMPTARGGIAAVAYNGNLVVVGGEGNEGTFREVEAFDPETGEWERLPDLPTPRHGVAAVVVEDRAYVLLGGPEPGFTMSDRVESLGPAPAD